MKIVQSNIKFNSTPLKRSATKKIVVHHADATTCDAKTIDKWHKNNGWSGIGYHFVVRKKDGIVETGRPIDTIGAHALNNNSDSVGICFEGNFDKETMSTEQLQTGKELIAYLRGIYGDNIQIVRHKDLMATDCPGKNFPFDKLIAKTETKKKAYSGKFPTLPKRGYFQLKDTGTQVKYLQKFLNWYGNYNLAVDGDYGTKTMSAVVSFQKSEKLATDGLFGSKSLAKAKTVKK